MAFSYTNKRGVTYFLHGKKSVSSSGKERVLYFFSKEQKAGVQEALPAGYKVGETANGLPILKKA